MLWNVQALEDSVVVNVDPDRPLAELSFAIQAVYEWFLGSGVSSWELARYKLPDNGAKVICRPLMPRKELQCSGITQLGGLVEQGLFPKNILSDKLWYIADDFRVADASLYPGQRAYKSNEGTLIVVKDLRPEISLSMLCFGLCDQTVGFFLRGARIVRYQGSIAIAQLFFSKGMDKKELAQFAHDQVSDEPDYTPEMKVGALK